MTKDVFIKEVRDAEAMLYHISKSILKNDSDCGDAVQETILNEKNGSNAPFYGHYILIMMKPKTLTSGLK